jgi:anti-anti-sigma factor
LGDVAILRLQGRIVNGETAPLRDAVNSKAGVSAVVLDMARVNAVDARGLGVMLELRQQAEAKGIHFKLMNVTRHIGRLLQITRLDSVFEITSRVELPSNVARSGRMPAMRLAPCA